MFVSCGLEKKKEKLIAITCPCAVLQARYSQRLWSTHHLHAYTCYMLNATPHPKRETFRDLSLLLHAKLDAVYVQIFWSHISCAIRPMRMYCERESLQVRIK